MGNFGLAPSEFWRMSPDELWWYLEAKLPPDLQESEPDWDELYALLED